MKTLLKILNLFFVALGVIFLIIIIALVYIFVADPFNLRPTLELFKLPAIDNTQASGTTDKHPLLTAEQEKTLESLGIDPAALPTQITPEMEKCFTEKLGAARVEEIKKTGQPSASDILKASSCISK